jgi:hypothetical protein
MPDRYSAADEHALIQEITAPLSMLPDNPVPIAADVDFPVVLRGYDRLSVDAYVQKTSQLVAELQATRTPEAAVRRALERVGDQVSSILQRAHETAGLVTAESRREAEDRLRLAREEATEITAAAEQRVRDLDADTDRIWAERLRIVEDSRQLARELLSLADAAAEQFPPADTGGIVAVEDAGSGPESMVDYTALSYDTEGVVGAPELEDEGPREGFDASQADVEEGDVGIAGEASREHPSELEAPGVGWPEPVEGLEHEMDPSATAAFAPIEEDDPGYAEPSQPPPDSPDQPPFHPPDQPPRRPDAASGP